MADITSNLTAWWKLEENSTGATVLDSSGNGINGTPSGSPTYAAGRIGSYCLGFNGSQYVNCGNSALLPAGTSPRTLAAWGKTNVISPGYGWMAAWGTGATGQEFAIGRNGSSFCVALWAYEIDSAGWDTTNWHHLCATYDGTTVNLYVDGVLNNGTGALTGSYSLVRGQTYIGCTVGPSEDWFGYVDDVRIYSRCLAAADVLALKNYPFNPAWARNANQLVGVE
jgi:hypothetical protein